MPLFSARTNSTKSAIKVEDADKSGWLHKEGGNNKEFRKRFFLLDGLTLTYYAATADVAKGASKGERQCVCRRGRVLG